MDLQIRPRLGLCIAIVLCTVAWCSPASAQIAGTNVNMVSGTQWPGGDPFLQRQNEPSIAVSSRNPFHLLAGANDYRSVDLALTTNGETGDAWLGLFKSLDGGATWRSTLLPGCPYNTPVCAGASAVKNAGYQAAADPTVRAGTNGMFYYAGLVFNRGFNPPSAIIVSRLIDLNNKENADPNDILNGDAIQYIGTSIVATGTSSLFLDKPSMAVDIPRGGASTCNLSVNQPGNGEVNQSFPAGNIYVAYTAFHEPPNTDPANVTSPQESTIYFVRSTNCGASWSQPIALNTGDTINQSVVLAINPNNGYIYAAWRQFHHQSSTMNQPDAIIVTSSTNGGKGFTSPVQVSTFAPFDEGTTATSFRTNAYPTMAVDGSGRVYIAYSARNTVPSGDARIVLTSSGNGLTWTKPTPVDNPPIDPINNPFGRGHQIMPVLTFAAGNLSLLYYDLRLDHTYGLFSPQFLQGQPTGLYSEMPVPAGELGLNPPLVSAVFNQFIDDSTITLRRHTFDLRITQALPGEFPVFAPSTLVSQYAYGCCATSQSDIEQLQFNAPNLPLFRSGTAPFMGDYVDLAAAPSFLPPNSSPAGDGIDSDSDDWHYNLESSTPTTFHAAWTDNRDVQAPADGNWTHYTPPNSPSLGSTSIFQPGTSTPACQVGFTGSRNQNIYTAPISNGLVFGAPTNTKQLGTTVFNGNTVLFQRAFAVIAQNTTNLVKSFRLTISNQPVGGNASFLQFAQLTTLDLSIPALSSATRPVFVTSTNSAASVTVHINEITAPQGTLVPGGLASSTTLNPDSTNPAITNPAITNPAITNPAITNFEVYNPAITNPAITNPAITNPAITNPAITNPAITNSTFQSVSVVNPAITNPAITNPAITNASIANPAITNPAITNVNPVSTSVSDTQWTLSNTGNTEGSFTLNLATASPVPLGNVLQLIISKLYQTPAAPSGQSCSLEVETHNVVVTNIVNPVLLNPTNPAITNNGITNPAITNPTVALAPGETANIIIRVVNTNTNTFPTFNPSASVVPVAVSQSVNTQTALSIPPGGTPPPPPITVPPLQITTNSLPDAVTGSAYAFTIQTIGGNPTAHTFSITSGALPAGLTLGAATGTISGVVTASGTATLSFQVQAQDVGSSSFPQHTATQNLTIRVGSAMVFAPLTLPQATQGAPYSQSISVTGGIGTITQAIVAGALPPGLTFNGFSGLISGTPAASGAFSFTIQASDSATPPQVVSQSYTLNVAATIATPANIAFVTQPANAVGGQILGGSPIIVRVSDNTGAAIPGATVTMAFNGTPPCAAAILSGTLSQVTTATGQAIFPDLSIDRGQLGYTLRAFSANVSTVSNPFTVNGYCGTSNLTSPRRYFTSTLLPNGKVLITGGDPSNGSNGSNSSEVFDPGTGTFAASGTMSEARAGHAAILLLNGQVLVSGGRGSAAAPDTAESYDPATGLFTLTGSMNGSRQNHTATLLADGRVLIAGGFTGVLGTNATYSNSAEIYDPATGTFTLTGNLITARAFHTATLLANGTVLIAGGSNSSGPLASAEIFDPSTGTFAPAGSMSTPRNLHTATLVPNQFLPDGKVLLAGGQTSTAALSSAELFVPGNGSFTPTGNMLAASVESYATLLPDGTVLVNGGFVSPATLSETYDPTAGAFTATGDLVSGRIGTQSTLLANGQVLVAGGQTPGPSTNPILNTAEIYYSTAPSAPIAIMTAALANASTGQPYTRILLEQGGLGNLTWTESGTLPTGITFSNRGVLSGTPTIGGSFPLIITVTDSSTPAKTISGSFTLTVNNSPLVFTSTTVPTAVAGKPYSQPIPVVGGTQPYNATVTSGTLPPGMSLSSNGVLNGTPSGTGTFSFTVTVTDSSTPTKTATQALTMTVNTLVFTTTVLPNGIVGVPYSAAINTAGGTLPLSFSLANTAFPPGLLIQQPAPASSSGALAGTPTLAGTYSFSESVVDSSSPAQTATQNYVVIIAPAGTPAPAKVAFVSQPQTSIGGQTLSGSPVVVSVADATNAPISGATVAMSFNGAPPCAAATLNGALTAVTDASGNATFSNLSIDRGQFGYTLLASAGSASAVSSPFNVQGFCNSANLSTQREFPTQVLLGTGKVLIAGGVDNLGNAINTAELYDPATGTTSPTGNLSDPNGRVGHISVLLPNGKVLLAGGVDNVAGFLNTAELYDPASGTFSPTGSMAHPRYLAEGVLLADGRVLVAGGNYTNVGTNTAEIYDPATGLWTPTGNMTQGRIRHRMTLLPNGKVLVTGGRDAAVNFLGLSSAELFDPFANQGAGAFTAIGNMNSVRFVHGQSLLSNGTVLIAGGFDNTFLSVTSAEIFDPATNLFTPTGNMNIGRSRHSSTLLPDGSVLETGGIDSVNGFAAPAPAELYLPTAGSFALTGSMTTGRELASATQLPNGNVLVSGGDDAVNVLNSTEVYYNTVPIVPIQITTATIPNAFAGQPYVAMALEQNGTGAITWSIVSGALPPGLAGSTIGAYGVVSGTPTTAGSYTFTAQVTDGHSVATRAFTINVSVATLAFTSNTVPAGGAGKPYSQPLPVTGGTPPYTATVTSGTLPPGLALSSNGVLSGTPSSAGSFTFTVSVTDSSTPVQTATQTLTIAVNMLFITTTALPSGMVGAPYSAVISTTGGTLPLTFSAANAAFPPGLAIQQPAANSPNGALAGTPTLAGHYTFTESVTDSSTPAQTATQSFVMDIFPAGTTAVPASAIFLSQPQNSVGGQILTGSPIRVRVSDASNTPIAGISVAMSFNGAPPCSSAVLSGALTAVTNGNGVAVFPDLSIDRGQLGYTLLASTGNLSVASQTLTVNGFCDTGSMATARALLNSVTLQNGKVLIAGGAPAFNNQAVAFSSAELYDPVAHSFAPVGSMHLGRSSISMAVLQNGLALVAGGFSGSTFLSSAELFDPATNTFTLLSGSLVTARELGVATLLANGKVLITGGVGNSGVLASAEIFDPATNTFTATSQPMSTPRWFHAAVLLPNGKVLITGGASGSPATGPSNSLASAEIYDPVTDTFTSTGTMASARYEHASALLFTGKVLVSGGYSGNGFTVPSASAEIYDPSTGTFSFTTASAGSLYPVPVLPDGTVFLFTGRNAQIYDPTAGTVRGTGDTTTIQGQPETSLLNDGTILVAGGVGSPTFNIGLANAEIYYSTAPLATLQITTASPLSAATQGKSYIQILLEQGGVGTLAWTQTGGTLPTGLTLSTSGILSGTPTAAGTFSFTVQLTDSGTPQKVTSATFSLTVNGSTLTFPAQNLPTAITGVAYAPSLSFSGGTPPVSFGVTSGSLPAGITLGTNGTFSGTPSVTGTFTFTVTATDSSSPPQNVSQNFSMVVANPLVITTTTLPGGQVGVAYNAPITTTGGQLPLGFSLATAAFPPGLLIQNPTVTSNTGALVGTPITAGTFTFSETVTDSSTPAQTASQSYTVTIAPAAVVPASIAFVTQPQNSIEGQVLAGAPVQVLVTDATNTPIPNLAVNIGFSGAPPCAAAGLGGTLTQNTDATGTATFSNLSIDRGQFGYSLAAAAGTISTISNPFNVEGFCDTGSLATARAFHSSVALPNGTVLVAGGTSKGDFTGTFFSSAELYDPFVHTFTTISSMNAARVNFTMTLLQNGLVLVAGGFDGTAALSSAELFNPATNTFTLLPASMVTARYEHVATLLPSGKVLITGGRQTSTSTLAGAELFDPATNTFTATTGAMITARTFHEANLLGNGKVLVTGGVDINFNPMATAEIYDPASDTFTATGSMATAREQHATALLFDGTVLVAGGFTGSVNALTATSSAELYNPATGTFSTTGSETKPLVGFAVPVPVLPDGSVLVAADSGVGDAQIYTPTAATFRFTGNMSSPLAFPPTALLPDGTVLLAGGQVPPPGVTSNAEIFYPIAIPSSINITLTVLPQANQNQPYTQQLLETGGVGALTWTLASGSAPLPAGLTLSTGGLLSGTPTQFGGFTFTVQVTDSSTPPKTAAMTYGLVVSPQFQFVGTQLQTALSGVAYNAGLPLVGGTPPYTSTLIAGSLPAGLTFANGTISGTTTALGTYSLTFQATDSSTPPTTVTATLTLGVTTPLGITTSTLPNGNIGSTYSAVLLITGGLGSITVAATSGSLPPGVVLSPQGVFSGTPTTAGSFTFSATALDQSLPPQSATQTYTITILAATASISLSPNPLNLLANNTGTMTVTLSSPPPANGQLVGFASSNSAVASVPPSVTILPPNTSATFQVTAGGTAGNATITASTVNYAPGTATVLVTARPMSLTTDGLFLAINRSFNATVTLAQPVPAGSSVSVALTASPSGLVSISPATQTIAAGQTTAVFVLSAGATPGSLVLSATASGYSTATAPLTVTANLISFGTVPVLAPGQSGSLPVSLSFAAPPGGLTINFASANTSVATITSSVFVPAGLLIPAANPQVTGVTIGSTQVNATAVGFAPDTANVTVTVTPTVSPNSISVNATRTVNVTLAISAAAPTGGITFNLFSDNTAVATVPATATVPQGQLSVTFGVTGVTQGTANLSVSSPGITTISAPITVIAAPAINLNGVIVGNNTILNPGGGLSVPPTVAQNMTLTSSDPAHFLLTTDPAVVGTATITVPLSPLTAAIPAFYVEGQNFPATSTTAITATLTATSSGYANGTATLTLYPTGLSYWPGNAGGTLNTTTFSGPSVLTAYLVLLTPGTLTAYTYGYPLGPQAAAVPVSITSSNTSVGTVTGSPASIAVGTYYTQAISFVPATAGTTNLNLATPSGYFTPANVPVQIVATVTAPAITVNGLIVGNNTIIPASIGLGAAPPSNAVNPTMTLTSSDPTHFLLTIDPAKVGTTSLTVNLTPGSFSVPTVYVEGQNFPASSTTAITATLTATSSGYANGTATLTLYPTGLSYWPGNAGGTLNTTTFSGPSVLTAYLVLLTPGTLTAYTYGYPLGPQAAAVPVSITSSNTSVGTVTGSPASIAVGTYYTQAISFVPATAGTTNLNLATPSGYFTPANVPVQIVATVTAPAITVNGLIVGNNTIIQEAISLGAAPPSNESLTLTSSDPTHFLLTTDPTKVGTASVTLQLTAGSLVVPVLYVEGQNFSGAGAITATLKGSAAGYSDGIATLSLYPTGLAFLGSGGVLSTTTSSSPTILTAYLTVLSPGSLTYYTCCYNVGPQAPGTVPVSVTSTSTAVGTVSGSPASIGVGTYFTQGISFVPVATGTTNLNLATPAGYFTPSDVPVQIVATVQ